MREISQPYRRQGGPLNDHLNNAIHLTESTLLASLLGDATLNVVRINIIGSTDL